jgi:hypothetical protein
MYTLLVQRRKQPSNGPHRFGPSLLDLVSSHVLCSMHQVGEISCITNSLGCTADGSSFCPLAKPARTQLGCGTLCQRSHLGRSWGPLKDMLDSHSNTCFSALVCPFILSVRLVVPGATLFNWHVMPTERFHILIGQIGMFWICSPTQAHHNRKETIQRTPANLGETQKTKGKKLKKQRKLSRLTSHH